MDSMREQVLSEFIDAWNAGRRPDVDEYIARVPGEEQVVFGEELATFLTFAPTPEYSDHALTAIKAEIAAAGDEERRPLFAALLRRLREHFGLTTTDLADNLIETLELTAQQTPKAASYLDRLETGSLEPARVSRRVFVALAHVFGVSEQGLEDAADRSAWALTGRATAAPVFRADEDAAARAERHLEVLADALAAPGGSHRDEVDELFLGGR
jgi:transcriptional regulator with XRE-family HTH domain